MLIIFIIAIISVRIVKDRVSKNSASRSFIIPDDRKVLRHGRRSWSSSWLAGDSISAVLVWVPQPILSFMLQRISNSIAAAWIITLDCTLKPSYQFKVKTLGAPLPIFHFKNMLHCNLFPLLQVHRVQTLRSHLSCKSHHNRHGIVSLK